MVGAKFDIDKFNGTNDFGLWKIKMNVLLVHNGIVKTIDEASLKELSEDKRKLNEIEKKTHSAILLSLGGKDLRKHLDDFNKITLVLCNIGVKLEEENLEIILVSSLRKTYEHFVDPMLYGKETLTMSEVRVALSSKEMQKITNDKEDDNGEGLFTRGRPQSRYNKTKNHKNSEKLR
uniref:Retrovirus-related Pol polyprotein from transposon TNT 1-94 n=1 Tax=Cannabis sativa TaxID=3483 RepID=A0A803PBL8_CANSA